MIQCLTMFSGFGYRNIFQPRISHCDFTRYTVGIKFQTNCQVNLWDLDSTVYRSMICYMVLAGFENQRIWSYNCSFINCLLLFPCHEENYYSQYRLQQILYKYFHSRGTVISLSHGIDIEVLKRSYWYFETFKINSLAVTLSKDTFSVNSLCEIEKTGHVGGTHL